MRKLRHYTFKDNTLPDVPFFCRGGENEKISLYRGSEKKEHQIAVFLPMSHSALFTQNLEWKWRRKGEEGELVQRPLQLKGGARKEKSKSQTMIVLRFWFSRSVTQCCSLKCTTSIDTGLKANWKVFNQLAIESYDKVARAAGYNSRFSRVVFQTCAFGNFIVPAVTLCVERVTCSLVPLPSMTSNFWIMIFIHVC